MEEAEREQAEPRTERGNRDRIELNKEIQDNNGRFPYNSLVVCSNL